MQVQAVLSPSKVLINEDVKSALAGFQKMVIGTTIVFLGGLLSKYLNDPLALTNPAICHSLNGNYCSSIEYVNWIAVGGAYVTALMAAVVTFVYNLCLKWLQANQYIVNK